MTITGQAVDAESGAPLPFASVQLRDLGRHVLANERGAFVLSGVPAGEHVAVVRQLGYETAYELWTVGQGGETEVSVRIPLAPRPIVLEGIRVQANRLEQRRRSVGVATRVFDQRQIHASGAGDTRQLLLRMAGLYTVPCSGGWSVDCLIVRGRQVEPSVWIDERPAFGGLWELESYAPQEIYRIEVFAGGRQVRMYTKYFIEHIASRPSYRPMPFVPW